MTNWLDRLLAPTASSPSIDFSFEKTQTPLLGEIHRPVVTVKVWSDVFNQWEVVKMLVDTGADYSLLPQYLGYLFATKRSKNNLHQTIGIGGNHQVHLLEKVKVKIGEFEREIPVGIASSNQIPPLMGRHLFFETFVTRFEKNRKVSFSL